MIFYNEIIHDSERLRAVQLAAVYFPGRAPLLLLQRVPDPKTASAHREEVYGIQYAILKLSDTR